MEKPNKRKADLERTRQIILSVASELFMTKGFKNTSTREIALKANITQPNLYHHFKNKKELYLALTNVRNDGAAWSVLSGQQWFFTVITIVALGLMGYFFWKLKNDNLYMLAISLLIAGTLGNFIDRIRLGYVVDMFETLFMNFPIFNVADMCLTFGVIIVIIALIKDEKDE